MGLRLSVVQHTSCLCQLYTLSHSSQRVPRGSVWFNMFNTCAIVFKHSREATRAVAFCMAHHGTGFTNSVLTKQSKGQQRCCSTINMFAGMHVQSRVHCICMLGESRCTHIGLQTVRCSDKCNSRLCNDIPYNVCPLLV